MEFAIHRTLEVLSATPKVVDSLLGGLSDDWIGPGTPEDWGQFEIVGHLIHCEEADWIPRARMILEGMQEHVHVFARLDPRRALADAMRESKASSSKWAKQYSPKFAWQRRYGAFTVSESASDAVRDYIRNQKKHHSARSFEDEYKILLRQHHIDFDYQYLWD